MAKNSKFIEVVPYTSPLKAGFIPAHTECAFRSNCVVVQACDHKGKQEAKKFSCAVARVNDQVAALSHSKDMAELSRINA